MSLTPFFAAGWGWGIRNSKNGVRFTYPPFGGEPDPVSAMP
jgi:hypothetical protein